MKFPPRSWSAARRRPASGVPAEVVEGLGPSRRPAVRVTINGYTYRIRWPHARGVHAHGSAADRHLLALADKFYSDPDLSRGRSASARPVPAVGTAGA